MFSKISGCYSTPCKLTSNLIFEGIKCKPLFQNIYPWNAGNHNPISPISKKSQQLQSYPRFLKLLLLCTVVYKASSFLLLSWLNKGY